MLLFLTIYVTCLALFSGIGLKSTTIVIITHQKPGLNLYIQNGHNFIFQVWFQNTRARDRRETNRSGDTLGSLADGRQQQPLCSLKPNETKSFPIKFMAFSNGNTPWTKDFSAQTMQPIAKANTLQFNNKVNLGQFCLNTFLLIFQTIQV